MTDLAALADELRERLNAVAYAKVIHSQDPTDTTWTRYETARCEAADWLYGKGDELQAALRASRPEPAADAVEAAAVRVADATLCQWGKPNDCGREGAPCLCEAAATAVLSALAAAQEGSR